MKSLKKYPCELIEKTCEEFVDQLWEISDEPKCRHLAVAIEELQEDLKLWLYQELTFRSIVEEKKIECECED